MAPGEKVMTTAPFGGWKEASGTFVAAAHVAAAMALGVSLYEITYTDMFRALLSEAGSDVFEEQFAEYCIGKNRLNIKKFLQVASLPPTK